MLPTLTTEADEERNGRWKQKQHCQNTVSYCKCELQIEICIETTYVGKQTLQCRFIVICEVVVKLLQSFLIKGRK